MQIQVEFCEDVHECETCGSSYERGAKVYFDGELVINLEPVAHCYAGIGYEEQDIFEAVLRKLGHNLEVFYV